MNSSRYGKLTFALTIEDEKKQEVFTFLNTSVSEQALRWTLSNPYPDHYVVLTEYWHESKDAHVHLTVAIMRGVFLEDMYHVYRDGAIKLIEDGKGIYHNTEEGGSVEYKGKAKEKRVWRLVGGGMPVTSETFKEKNADFRNVFD
ncbi:unnamed protein product [Somion occarium]|uniref:Uncharacterized protein n=1 Tax=Somion occarium TaxID=3059160 RepID=A0ABP1EB16_9APHY